MKTTKSAAESEEREPRHEDAAADATDELNDTDLESVAGGITWHLPNDSVTTPWADDGEI